MRQVVFAWLTLMTTASAVEAQGWANKLFKDQTTHDFGTVARGAQLFHRFPITNIYAVPLEITNTRASCGCVSVVAKPLVLQPRETGHIEVTMDARKFNGNKVVAVHVTVGPQYISTAELRVSATSRADVVFNPSHVAFGNVNAGGEASQVIDVEYAGALDWKVTELLAKDQPFEATIKELYRRPGQVGYQVRVTLKPEAPTGALKREIHLRTNDPASPLIAMLVEANVQSGLSVSPTALRLGQSAVGELLVKKVVVRGQKPFRILGVDGLGGGITLNAEPTATPAATQVLQLKIELLKAGDLFKELKIRTDLQPEPLTVSVEANVAAN